MIVQYRHITYIKIRVPFQANFKDSSQKPYPHILKLPTSRISSRAIHTITGIISDRICIKFTYYCLNFIVKSC